MKKAVIFDLDGTLWDSSREIALAWSSILEGHGFRITQADVQAVMGKTSQEIAALFFPDRTPEEQMAIFDACSDAELVYLQANSAILYPHLEETLEQLSHKYTLCLVSNCQEGYIETFFECTGLGRYFADTECAGHTNLPKSDNIRRVVERNAFDAAVYVGDTQKDLDSAVDAGLPFIHAAYGFGTVPADQPAIHSLAELPPLADTFLK